MKHFFDFTFLLFACALAGCSTTERHANLTPTIHLTAVKLSPTDIQLNWSDTATRRAAGHIVEYATDPNGQFVTLGFLPPDQMTFTHSNLMPETTFYYRVRAFYGPASVPIKVSLPDGLSEADYFTRYTNVEDYSWAVPETVGTRVQVSKASIRSVAAAPTDLRAVPILTTVSGFKLTWTDHASDEDGYLLEMKPEGSADFTVCALFAPNINSIGYAFAPPARKASFRVRPFYYGTPSNVAEQITGTAVHAAQNFH